MTSIAICICTKSRKEGLRRLLNSIDSLIVPDDIIVNVIVIENDTSPYSEEIVRNASLVFKHKLFYYLEPVPGIVYARNRSVREASGNDYCCFVDDDQIVSTDWLFELVKCQKEFNADGVWGANPPVFSNNVHSSVKRFFQSHSQLYEYGAEVKNGYTNCLLLSKKWLDEFEGPFDNRLNFSGGEDVFLTGRITKKGGVIINNPFAVAYEIIPEERTRISYILKRSFRNSNTAYYVDSLDSDVNKFRTAVRLLVRLGLGIVIAIPFILFSGSERLKGLIMASESLGGLSFILGRHNQFYK